MILADTSVWVEHFRRGLPPFAARLEGREILAHEVVLGEIASGNLSRRKETLEQLCLLPRVQALSFDECMKFLESHR